ncbi:MAG: NAD(P)H-dependent oxidoreductase subunit E [Candidatus Brocadiia bacterium]
MSKAQIPTPPSPNQSPSSMPSMPLSTSSTMAAPPETEPLDLAAVDRIISEIGRERRCALPILQAVQAQYHYLPLPALIRVCETTEISPAQIEGVATFYSQFRRMPVGRHLVSVCHGTACHVAGAEKVTEAVRRHLRLEGEADTDSDKLFTVQKVACLGCCSLAPVVRIDDRVYGHVAGETAGSVLEKFLRQEEERARSKAAPERRPPRRRRGAEEPVEIRIGLGSCCMASGSAEVKERLDATLRAMGEDVVVKCGACIGMCHRVPLVEFTRAGRQARYAGVKPSAVRNILAEQLRPAGILRQAQSALRRAGDLLTTDSSWQPARSYSLDPESGPVRAFLAKQKEIVLEGRGEMDPLDIDEYRAHGGYAALEKCLRELSPDAVIQIIKDSGLRGRGGAGYPAGAKWAAVRRHAAPKKCIIMNGDEGDPGAFMDRMMLESYPHRVLEGLAIAAYAVGAGDAFLYIRAEYPLAVRRAREAIRQAAERGYFGNGDPGAFNVKLHVMEGAGAFVCGEETGLIASLEGRRGMPRFRPPYPAESGLWGMPTSVNNVETYANVPWIIRHGAEAYAAVGTATSKGTKVFALAGKVVRGGLIEVPMGITIGEIVEDIGGGIRDERKFKAVQIGGPSGGCIPASLRDTRIDYEELTKLGAMMGSGGLVVMDDTACMVDMARFFLQFTQNESCGKCTFCRIGTKRMLEILDRLCAGEGKGGDIERLEELSEQIRRTSLCGLGQTAPNPVRTTLKYFRDEYEAHLHEKRCPAKRCRALIRYTITDRCFWCTLCAQQCPADAIEPRPYEQHEIDQTKCIRCGTCAAICPAKAVDVETG